jgi:hypothetical protein
MAFPAKNSILEKRRNDQAEIANNFRVKIVEEMEKFEGGQRPISVPKGLNRLTLNAIVVECQNAGWTAQIHDDQRDGTSLIIS